jgi:hypothetical protein
VLHRFNDRHDVLLRDVEVLDGVLEELFLVRHGLSPSSVADPKMQKPPLGRYGISREGRSAIAARGGLCVKRRGADCLWFYVEVKSQFGAAGSAR